MKKNHYNFGKEEYESFMRRLDRNRKGKVNIIDFRHAIFPHGRSQALSDDPSKYNIQNSIENFNAPIQSLSVSATKNHMTNELQQMPTTVNFVTFQPKSTEQSESNNNHIENKMETASPSQNRQKPLNSDRKISPSQERVHSSHKKQRFEPEVKTLQFSDRKPANPPQQDYTSRNQEPQRYDINDVYRPNLDPRDPRAYQSHDPTLVSTVRSQPYNDQIEAIKNNPLYQTSSTRFYPGATDRNPLENRFQDPIYSSYWNYSRDHNATITPSITQEYHNKLPYDYKKYENYDFRKSNSKFVPYFNPSFVEREYKPDFYRYPENPFKYTDHEHYFKNYYSGLRSNYYDKYYNSSPDRSKYESRYNYNYNYSSYENTSRPYLNYQSGRSEEPLRFYPTKYSSRVGTTSNFYKPSTFVNNENYNSYNYIRSEVEPPRYDYSSNYTPNSKREGINVEKPRSAIKIEDNKPSGYQPNLTTNTTTEETKRTLEYPRLDTFSANEVQKRDAPSDISKSYKFANNQYESLWKEEEAQDV